MLVDILQNKGLGTINEGSLYFTLSVRVSHTPYTTSFAIFFRKLEVQIGAKEKIVALSVGAHLLFSLM